MSAPIDPNTLAQVSARAGGVIDEVQRVFVGPRQVPELDRKSVV